LISLNTKTFRVPQIKKKREEASVGQLILIGPSQLRRVHTKFGRIYEVKSVLIVLNNLYKKIFGNVLKLRDKFPYKITDSNV